MCGLCLSVRQLMRCQRRAQVSGRYSDGAGAHQTPLQQQQEPIPLTNCEDSDRYVVAPCPCMDNEMHIQDLGPSHRGSPTTPLHISRTRFSEVVQNIQRRGPDHCGITRRSIIGESESRTGGAKGAAPSGPRGGVTVISTEAQAVAAVLGLRGHAPVHQPYEIDVETDVEDRSEPNKSFLMFNGEIFNGALCPPPWGSDTIALASRLSQLEQHCATCAGAALLQRQQRFLSGCVRVFEEEVEGPYGVLFYASQLELAVFGRDPLGKRSLLAHVALYRAAEEEDEEAGGGGDNTETQVVEFIVSSVGVQHSGQREPVVATTGAAGAGEAVEMSQAARQCAGGCNGEEAVIVERKKRQRVDDGHDDDEADCDDEEAGADGDGRHHPSCWVELPVTGLFGLRLNAPLVRTTKDCTGVEGVLLLSRWRQQDRLVHPLLRVRPTDPHYANASIVTMPWLADSVADLPARMAHLILTAASAAVDMGAQGGLDNSALRARVAAVRYMASLAKAVLRRCNVANSGAENARDAHALLNAQRRPLCILFSGGIDCTVLAALAHYVLPVETPIELVNVAFGEQPEQAPDRVAALRAMQELLNLPQPSSMMPEAATLADMARDEQQRRQQEREWRLVLVDVPQKVTSGTSHILDLITPRNAVMDLDIGTALWHAARGAGRMQRLRSSDATEVGPPVASSSPFSDRLSAFSKHFRVHEDAEVGTASSQNAPNAEPHTHGDNPQDTAEDKFDPLVEILVVEGRAGSGPDAPVLMSTLGKEYAAFLQPVRVRHGYKKLGNYLNDASRAGVIAFVPSAPAKAICLVRQEDRLRARARPPCRWFTTRRMASEALMGPPSDTVELDYVSCAKVLLLGMGADETLGGYTRYRRFYHREGMLGARRELAKDFSRLWKRNLGRDDRIAMDSGREPRLPFLDEQVLATLESIVAEGRAAVMATAGRADSEGDALLQASIDPVVSFTLNAGEGDKRILRNAARLLGLDNVTRLQKRALQFGSRIAERKVRGSAQLQVQC